MHTVSFNLIMLSPSGCRIFKESIPFNNPWCLHHTYDVVHLIWWSHVYLSLIWLPTVGDVSRSWECKYLLWGQKEDNCRYTTACCQLRRSIITAFTFPLQPRLSRARARIAECWWRGGSGMGNSAAEVPPLVHTHYHLPCHTASMGAVLGVGYC